MSLRAPVVALALALAAAPAIAAPQQASGAAAAAAAAGDTALPTEIRRVFEHASMRGARYGIVATSIPDGEVVLSYGAGELFAPASVTKLFTTAAALSRLGPHFVWETPIAYRGDRAGDQVRGDLWVLGRGAPDLVEERLWLVAEALQQEGLARIAGDLVVDDRYFDDERYGSGWPGGGQAREAYHSPISALMANFAAERGEAGWVAVQDPALHFGQRLRYLMGKAGVALDGIVRRPLPEELQAIPAPAFSGPELGRGTVVAPLVPLHVIRSEPLARLVMDINKFSNNVMAESLLKTLGAIEYGAPGTATKGLAVVASVLDSEIGIPLNSFVQADGSGLSRLDRFTPAQVSRLLQHAWSDFHIGPELIASLKLGGLDGWNPAAFKRPPLLGEARLKSGHIRGVNALSGFVHTGSGRTLAFCAMVNDHRAGQWEIDQRMAELVDALIRTY